MIFSRFVVALWFAALLAAFALNRFSPQGRPLGLALMLLQTVFLFALAVRLWRVVPRLPAAAVGAAALLLLYVATDQFALACGWW